MQQQQRCADDFHGLHLRVASIERDIEQSIRKVTSAASFDPSAISDTDREALNIYYVACTRSRMKLINATEL